MSEMGGPPIPARVGALDGLRGWAALCVVTYHMTWELFGLRFPEFRSPFVSLFANGHLAVAVFFCISGYVLTINRWRREIHTSLLLTLIKRYIRLTLPIAATVLIVWALMTLSVTPASDAAPFVNRDNWIADFADFRPKLLDAIIYALGGVYISSGDHSYTPFLWTMIVELWGSILVLTLSRFDKHLWPYAPLLLVLAASLLIGPLGALPACFIMGALIALAERDGLVFYRKPGPREQLAATLAIPLTVVGAAVAHQLPGNPLFPSAVFGVALFVSVLRSDVAQRLLTLPASRFLGQLSFPIYLAQYIVLITAVSYAVIWLGAAAYLSPWSAMAVSACGVVLSLALAMLLLPVERAALSLGRRLSASATRGSSPGLRRL